MSAKENPDWQAGGSSESRFASTPGESHIIPTKTSEIVAQARQKEPREGTQLAVVLETLRSRPDQWVGVNEIMRNAHCAAAHSAISTLRQRYGFRIENRMSRSEGGIVLSEYKLEEVSE